MVYPFLTAKFEANAITIGIEADMSIQNDEEEMTWSLPLRRNDANGNDWTLEIHKHT